jgi:hypothetical protein
MRSSPGPLAKAKLIRTGDARQPCSRYALVLFGMFLASWAEFRAKGSLALDDATAALGYLRFGLHTMRHARKQRAQPFSHRRVRKICISEA